MLRDTLDKEPRNKKSFAESLDDVLRVVNRHNEVLAGAAFFLFVGAIFGGLALDDYLNGRRNAGLQKQQLVVEQSRIKAGYQLFIGDINGQGGPKSDKFYVIDGKLAVVELDGKPVVEKPAVDLKLYQ